MTDAHCHVSCGDARVRELLIGRDFFGCHPWDCLDGRDRTADVISALRAELAAHPAAGVGEIGLDRLKVRDVPPVMHTLFEAQLQVALALKRPVVLHGAKCWGQVVQSVNRLRCGDEGVAFLFHGFSRSDGLLPDIVRLNGFISVGPAVLNDHAVNYRALVKKIPIDRLLVETDRTEDSAADCPGIADVLAKVADLRGMSCTALEAQTDANAAAFAS